MQRSSLADMMINDCYSSNNMFGGSDPASLVAKGAAAGAKPKILVTALIQFLMVSLNLKKQGGRG